MIELLAAIALAPAIGAPVDDRDPVLPPQPGWHERQIPWTLAGVGPGARSILVQPGLWGGCDQGPPVVRVRESAERIVVEAVVLEPDGIEAMICPAIAGVSEPERVALDAPVAGRPVEGPERHTAPGAAIPQTPDAERAVPRVVGLRAADARRALCGWRLRARGATGDAVVTGQRPRPGTELPAGMASSTGAESCSDLPRRPSVRLRVR